MNFKKFLSRGILLGVLASSASYAVKGGFIGGGLGVSKIDWSGADAKVGISFNGGVVITPNFSLGLDVQLYRHEEKTILGTVAYNFTPFMLTANYYFESVINGPFIGAMIGRTTHTIEVLGYEFSASAFGYGGHAGWNFQVSDSLGLGPRFTYIHSNDNDNVDSLNYWSLLANLTYFF